MRFGGDLLHLILFRVEREQRHIGVHSVENASLYADGIGMHDQRIGSYV